MCDHSIVKVFTTQMSIAVVVLTSKISSFLEQGHIEVLPPIENKHFAFDHRFLVETADSLVINTQHVHKIVAK